MKAFTEQNDMTEQETRQYMAVYSAIAHGVIVSNANKDDIGLATENVLEAIAAWNQRHLENKLRELVARLRKETYIHPAGADDYEMGCADTTHNIADEVESLLEG